MASRPFIPPELVDAIFSHVTAYDESKTTFKSCALVSRTWRDLTCPYLFDELVFKITTSKSGKPGRTLTQLLYFFAGSFRVRRHVRSIKLISQNYLDLIPAELLANIFRSLRSLNRISLKNIKLDYDIARLGNLPVLSSLERLEVGFDRWQDMTSPTPKELMQYISFFGHVKELLLCGLAMKQSASRYNRVEATDKLPTIEAVVIHDPSSPGLVLSAIQCLPARGLHTVKLIRMNTSLVQPLSQFFAAVGPNLKHIDLGRILPCCRDGAIWHNSDQWKARLFQLDLRPCSKLQSLAFLVNIVIFPVHDPTNGIPFNWEFQTSCTDILLMDVISHIFPPGTRELRLTIAISVVDYGEWHMRRLGSILERDGGYWAALEERWMQCVDEQGLKKICIMQEVGSAVLCAQGEDVVNALLPRLAAKGVLDYRR